jgi:hypothetical protein
VGNCGLTAGKFSVTLYRLQSGTFETEWALLPHHGLIDGAQVAAQGQPVGSPRDV